MNYSGKYTFGELLKQFRARERMNQQQLGRQVGVHRNTIVAWEQGNALPKSRPRVLALADALLLNEQEAENLLQSCLLSVISKHSEVVDSVCPPSLPSLWNVPHRRNPFFTGREDILTCVQSALHSDKAAALTQVQAMSGLGGIGKTQTAIEYAYRSRCNYSAVFWIRAETRDVLMADFVTLAELLNLPEKDEQNQDRVIKAVKQWLNTTENWLLILDNVEDFTLIADFLPSEKGGHILLTTRAQSTGTLARRIDVEQMTPDEGTLFLLRRAKLVEHDALIENAADGLRATATAISHMMDGLPLALDQAGAYIEETGCRLLDYLDHYQARRAILLDRRGSQIGDHPESVSTTFSLSFEKVEQTHPVAAELLRLCAFLAADAIPEEIITEGASELCPLLQPLATDSLALDTALATLRKYSLLRRNAENKTLAIHRLVQAVLKERMDESTQHQWAERTVRVVNRAFPDSNEAAMWPWCLRYLPHALACVELIDQWKIASREAGRLLNQTGTYLREHAQYVQAEVLLCKARDVRMQALGLVHLDVAESLEDLAGLYHCQGKYTETELLLQQSLNIREQQLGVHHSYVAQSLNNLALLYWTQGRHGEAEPLYQRALTIWEKQLSPGHFHTAKSLSGLALLYRDQAKYDQAEPLFQRALTILEQQLGIEHPATAQALNNLAVFYRIQGRYTEAEPLLQRALNIRELQLGTQHPGTAQILNNLAKLYAEQGKHIQAGSLFQRALTIREQQLGLEHPDTVATIESYAALLRKTERTEEAARLEARAKAIRAEQHS